MKKLFVFCFALMLAILPMGMAMAETIMICGTVINTQPQPVVCTADGAVDRVNVAVGDRVAAGDVIATVATNKVYATMDGTVYLFGEIGDQISDITARYGAVAYIAPANPYTITAAAVDRNGNAVSVIPGETVYLRCYKDGQHTGKGILGKIEQGEYTVVVTEGEFAAGEMVSVYRDEAYTGASRIGRARVDAADMVACKGDGCLGRFHVASGTTVTKGTLLYETISGDFAPGSTHLDNIIAPADGIVAAISTCDGTIDEAAVPDSAANPHTAHAIAEIYPDDGLCIVAYAPESALNAIHVNDAVYVSWQYLENAAAPVPGTVEKISRIPTPEERSIEAYYAVYVAVSDASCFYYGMNVVVAVQKGE